MIPEIQSAINEYLQGLNWHFIITLLLLFLGVEKRKEFAWYNRLTKESDLKEVVLCLITGVVYCLFRYLDNVSPFNSIYISSILRSIVVAMIIRDNDNFIDWLCQQNKQLLNKIDMLKFQLKAADSVNDVLEKLRTSDNEAWSKQCAEWMTKHEQIWNECLSANNKIDELEKLLLNK